MAPTTTKPKDSPAAKVEQKTDPDIPPGFDSKRWMSEQLDKMVEYKPFKQDDPIKLSARLVLKFLCTPTKSGKVCSEEQAQKFIMLCKARQLNPWEGDAYLIGYDSQDGPTFSLITAHQAFLKRAEASPEYDGMNSGVVVIRADTKQVAEYEGDLVMPGDTLIGGWARVYRKDRTHPTYRRVALSTFNKGFGRWKIDPAGMIVKCAEADAQRSTFPNNLAGMHLQEEIDGEPASTVTTAQERVARIKAPKSATNGTHTPTPTEPEATPEPPRETDQEDDGIGQPPNLPPNGDSLYSGGGDERDAIRG